MRIAEIREIVVTFYRNSDKPTFWFTVIIMSRLVGFIPSLPKVLIYGCFMLYGLYVMSRDNRRFYLPLLCFLIYIPIQLVLVSPDEMFNSWERFILFALLLVCVSPLFVGEKVIEFRQTIFRIMVVICTFIGVGSFLARFLGINYGTHTQFESIMNIGTFGGLTTHSMLLGPVAGIGAVFCGWLGYAKGNRIYWVMSALCLFSVMFSASRSSLMATIAGMTIALYKLSGSGQKFVKLLVIVIMVGAVTFPLWGNALAPVIAKNEGNIAAGGIYSSRDALWNARISEFENHPIFGVGFDAIDLDISRSAGGYDEVSGMVEAGSSWLIILSMTGIVGAMILLPLLIKAYLVSFREANMFSSLVCGVLTLFYVHMIAEGYIFYGGSALAAILWITIGVAYDRKYV